MKCKKIEPLIYLYPELDKREKDQVRKHVDTCSSCKILFEQVSHQHVLINSVREIPISQTNAQWMMHNIMSAIEGNERKRIEKTTLSLNMQWLRVSFSLISIALTAFFIFEFSSNYSSPINTTSVSSDIRLYTPHFLQAQLKKKSTNQVSFYDCVKQSDCDFLKNFKNNKNL